MLSCGQLPQEPTLHAFRQVLCGKAWISAGCASWQRSRFRASTVLGLTDAENPEFRLLKLHTWIQPSLRSHVRGEGSALNKGDFLLLDLSILRKQKNITVFKPLGTKQNFLCTYYCGYRSACMKSILWLHQRGKSDGVSMDPHTVHTHNVVPRSFWIA